MASQQDDNMQETRGSSGSGGDGAKSQASKPSPSSVPNVSSDNNNEGGEAPKFRGRPTTRGRRHPGAFATPEAIAAAIKSANELFEQCQQRKRAKEAEAAEAAKKSVDEQNIQQQQRQQEQKANSSESILDRQNRATAAVLTRFREMVKAVTEPLPKNGAILEAAKLNVLEMQTQTAAFNKEVKDLVSINRQIKFLWMQGPLEKPGGDDAQTADTSEKLKKVNNLYDKIQDMIVKQHVEDMRAQAEAAAMGEPSSSPADDDEKKPTGEDEDMDETK